MRKILILSLLLSFAFASFAQQLTRTKEAVIDKGVLKFVELDYNPATGERTVVINGVRKNFYDVYPKTGSEYAKGQSWFTNSDSIIFNGNTFKKYGLPRVLSIQDVTKTSMYKGLGVYTETGTTGVAHVIYIPVQLGGEFQPYQIKCKGSIVIEKVSSSETSVQFRAKTTGLTGNISYVWESQFISIHGGQGSSNVVLDLRYSRSGDQFYLGVDATDANKCPISAFEKTYVTKLSAPSLNSNWNALHRKEFIESCISNSGLPEADGRAFCSCMLEKVEKKYPNPETLERDFKKEDIEPWAKECRPKAQ